MFAGIIAVGVNNVIGKDGKIPWRYSDDLRWFRKLTYGNIVVMGRKTFQSINEKELDGRLNIILSRKARESGGIIYLQKKESMIKLSEYLKRSICIIGGSQIYSLFSDNIDEWLISRIPDNIVDGDTFFNDDWIMDFSKREEYKINEKIVCEHFVRKGNPLTFHIPGSLIIS